MARKRKKPCGDGAVESPGEFANPEDGTVEPSPDFANKQPSTMESSAELAKPVYLVATRDDGAPGYSIFKIDAAAADKPPRARTVAGLPGAERGMSFVAAHSTHGSWVVGVGGGPRAATVILDPRTWKTFDGPRLCYPKHKPVLISHRGQVYAISERPRVVGSIDREPWFESLSFNQGVPSDECSDRWISWSFLPPPPFFPCLLDPYEFRNPPEISASSYAAVGSHILLSPQRQLMLGTYAFHVVSNTWEKVHDKNLPFLGQAVPLGGGLFAACPISISNNNNAANAASALVLQMSIKVTSAAPSLLIQEFKVAASEDRIPLPLFCPLGTGSFCCIRLGASCPRRRRHKAKEIQVILTVFRMENMEDIMTTCQSQAPKAKDLLSAVLQVKEQSHICEYKHLLGSDMPAVAALSMDTEIIDLGEETTETRARRATDSTIFEAPVIRKWYWS